MKKILLFIMCAMSLAAVKAEDVLQVIPFTASAGATEDDEVSFEIALTNTREYTALQFDLFLPEGLTICDEEVYLNDDRCPYTISKKGVKTYKHEAELTDKGNGHYFITVYASNLETFEGNSGALLELYFATDDNMKEGYYPITISGTKLAISGTEGVYPATSTSYVKIVSESNPTPELNSALLSGYVPSFVVDEINKEDNVTCLDMTNVESTGAEVSLRNLNALQIVKAGSAYAESVAGKNNIVIDGMCNNLVLTDGASFSAPAEFTAAKAAYTRAKGSNTWGSICLPYEVKSDEAVAYYTLSNVNEESITVELQETLPAGTPALYKNLTDGNLTANAEDVTVSGEIKNAGGIASLVGSYTYDYKVYDPNSYYIKDDAFHKIKNWFYCDAFRAYLTVTSANSSAFSITADDLTAVDAIIGSGDVTIEAIYDAAGQPRSELKSGLNIVKFSNGKTKKIIIK